MRRLSCLLCLAGLSAPTVAQFVPTATTAVVNVHTATLAAPALPAGTAVWGGFVRDANATTSSAHLDVGNTFTATSVDLVWHLTSAASNSGLATSEAELVYQLSSPLPIVGHLQVTWVPVTSGHGSAALEVDLGADGSVETTGSASLPVAAGPGVGVVLRIHALSQANAGILYGPWGTTWNYSGSAQAVLQVRFEPTPVNVQTVAPACGTAMLGAVANLLEGIDFTGSLPAADDIVMLVLGLAPANAAMPLPWSTCMLAVEPVVVMWQPVVANANALWSLHVPAAVRPVGVFAQMLGIDLDAPALTSSSALRAALQ